MINSIFTDWDKLAKEAEAINNKYNSPKEQRCEVTKQTKGNIYAAKNQHHIDFAFAEKENKEVPKTASEKIAPQVSKLSRSFVPEKSNYLQSSKSISSVEAGEAQGMNKKYIKSESSLSIWQDNSAPKKDLKEITLSNKEAEAQRRKTMREEANDKLVEALQNVDLRKASSVYSASTDEEVKDSQSFKVNNHISLFDNNEFSKLPELTSGEEIRVNKAAEKKKRDENKYISNSSKTSDMFDKFLENIIK